MAVKSAKKSKVLYAWRDGSRVALDAQAAGEELARIADEHGGELRPRQVVDESRPEESPLHPHFEWDDGRAADLYRDEQARNLIRSVRVVTAASDGTTPPEVRLQYVCVAPPGGEDRVYVEATTALSDDVLSKQVIAEALAGLRGWKSRFGHIKELAGVVDAINRIEGIA